MGVDPGGHSSQGLVLNVGDPKAQWVFTQLQGLIYEIGGPWAASAFPKGRRMACL